MINSKDTKTEPTQSRPVRDSLVSFDWAIKYLLRNKKNFDVLEGFLSELLRQDVYIDSILDSESNQQHQHDKYNRVDLLVKTRDNEKIIIEVQCSRQYDYLNRIIYGVSKAITENISRGEPYSEISKVISISILYFNLGEGEDYIYSGRTQFKGLHNQDALRLSQEEIEAYNKLGIKTPEDIFPEYYLIRVDQFNQRVTDNLDEWIYLLKNAATRPEFKAKGIKAAEEKLLYIKLDDEERARYDAYMKDLHQEASMVHSHYGRGERRGLRVGEKKGLRKGRLEGLKEGELKAKWETARNMHTKGMDHELIAELTGLSVEVLTQKLDHC